MSAGDILHYHGAGPERYGHRHPFLHINHDHDHDTDTSDAQEQVAAALLAATAGRKEPS